LVTVATGAGLPCSALITDMNEVLGHTAGNALETRESIEHLTGKSREPRLHEVTVELALELLVHTGLAPDEHAARQKIAHALDSGAAAERFGRMAASLGGPTDLIEHTDRYLPLPPVNRSVLPTRGGYIHAMDVRAIGVVVMGLGGGRHRADDTIDPLVGLSAIRRIGESVGPTVPLCTVHARSEPEAEAAATRIRQAIELRDHAPENRPIIAQRL
jgi:thymidine phosphorylase